MFRGLLRLRDQVKVFGRLTGSTYAGFKLSIDTVFKAFAISAERKFLMQCELKSRGRTGNFREIIASKSRIYEVNPLTDVTRIFR